MEDPKTADADSWESIISVKLNGLKKGERSFVCGQEIQGHVMLKVQNTLEINDLAIKFEGNGKFFTVKKSPADNEELGHEIKLLEQKETNASHTLGPGSHKYPFKYTLPSNLPLSFLCPKWALSYCIQATVTLAEGQQTLSCVIPFDVKGSLDLNGMPGLDQKAELYKEKRLCGGCCGSANGQVKVTAMLLRRGFVPGEYVDFLVEIENIGKQNVTKVTVRLVQNVILTVGGGYKKLMENIMAEIIGSGVQPECKDLWRGERVLKIPDAPPTKVDGNTNIGLEYDFQIEIEVSGCTKNYKGNIPIVIGTIPLKGIKRDVDLDEGEGDKPPPTRPKPSRADIGPRPMKRTNSITSTVSKATQSKILQERKSHNQAAKAKHGNK